MANALLAQGGDGKVGKNWVNSFVKRREELRSMFTRKYDYRRALSEDPDIIKEWFALPLCRRVQNEPKTPHNTKELELQTTLVKEKIRVHKIAR
jgi:homoserine dehydrogenase